LEFETLNSLAQYDRPATASHGSTHNLLKFQGLDAS